ncbi:uncharacterized protein LOC141850314 [Brevipalpus obovatus]|uniref:uncharacterized protein LOC141850314 n=1 Tax=Brevipalpus obovatus TaxID=246614 RepID=UPI003D9F5480
MESKIASVLCIFTFILIGFICADEESSAQAYEKHSDSVVGELIRDITFCRDQIDEIKSFVKNYMKCDSQWADKDRAVFQGIVAAYHSGKLEHSQEAVSELERLKKNYVKLGISW